MCKPDVKSQSLPEWFEDRDNAYFCGLIARQLRTRAVQQRACGQAAQAIEAECIAAIVEAGDFHWLN
jgi:hypothetical protein